MAKIVLVTSFFNFSGPNNVLRNLIKGFNLSNEDFVVCSLRRGGDKKYINSLETTENNCLEPEGNSFIHLLKIILSNKPLVVHSSGIRADIFTYILSFFFSFKAITTVHNIPNEDYLYRYGKVMSFLMLLAHGLVFRSERVRKVCVSKNVENNLISKLGGRNCTVIYNGVDEELYRAGDVGSQSDRKRIVFCGHLSPLKNPLELADVAGEFPNCDFIYLGSGPLYDELNTYSDNVYTYGRVDNVSDELSISNVFVMPSKTEGMPMAFIEALFSNIPVVCSNIPIFEEIGKIPTKSNIYIFELGSRESLINSIRSALELRKSCNREFALERFSYKIMSEGYLIEYKTVNGN